MNNTSTEELNNRLFDPCVISLLVVPTKIFYKVSENFIVEKEVYTFFSCSINAKRKYLSSVLSDKYEKVSDWYDFFLSLKSRGINIILYAVIPDNEQLSKALKLTFNEVSIFISCIEAVNKLCKYYSYGYSKSIYRKVRKVFLSPTVEEYNLALTDFNNEYMQNKFICDILESDLKRAKSYYSVDFNIRSFVFSFYFVREVSKKLSIVTHSVNYFSTLDDLISPLIPFIQTIEKRMFCTKNQLIDVINIIYKEKKDLILPYL